MLVSEIMCKERVKHRETRNMILVPKTDPKATDFCSLRVPCGGENLFSLKDVGERMLDTK